MPISEDVSFDLILNDSKIKIKTALDSIVSRIQVHYSNEIAVKPKKDYEGYADYWMIVERIPVRFFNFTLWRKNRIIVHTDSLCIYSGGFMSWFISVYDRKIYEIVVDEINKFSAHYPIFYLKITKHFRPLYTEPGHLIAGDALL